MKKAATEYVPHANDINEEARKKLYRCDITELCLFWTKSTFAI